MNQLIFASLSHIHYWYEVDMLKVRPGTECNKNCPLKMGATRTWKPEEQFFFGMAMDDLGPRLKKGTVVS